MAILTTSQMSIVDLSDLPTLGLYLTSTLPATVIYDPDNSSYVPDWSSNNLVLTPVIRLDSELQSLTDTQISIEWKKKYGTQNEEVVISGSNGETISNGVLTVANNKFINYSTVTYICIVTYTDGDTGGQVSGQTQMTYSLIRNAPTVRSCSIVGNNVFLYDGERNIIGDNTITLTAILNNVSVSKWQYYNGSSSVWVDYSFSDNTGETLTIKESDSCFYNDVAKIKLLTTDSSIFDMIQIVKIKDGAAGGNSIVVQLSNESHLLPADGNGNVISYTGADTVVTVYEGGDDVSNDWAIIATSGSGVTGTSSTDSNGHLTYTVTSMTDDSSYVEFICQYPKTGTAQTVIKKRFSLIKNRSGSDAVSYFIQTPHTVIHKDKNDNYSPTAASISGYSRVGKGTASLYSGIYKFYLSTNGTDFTLVKTVGTASNPVTGYNYPGSNDTQFHNGTTYYTALKCEMYDNTGATLLDVQTIYIVNDGMDGINGNPGTGGYSVTLGNYSETIPCNSDSGNTVTSAMTINIPFTARLGIDMIECTAGVVGLPSGMTSTTTKSTSTSQGKITIQVEKGSTLNGSMSGEITLTFTSTINGSSVTTSQVFSWSKTIQGTDGENAINFYIHPVNGVNVFENGKGDVTLQAYLLDGATDVSNTNNVTYAWSLLVSGSWSATKGMDRTYSVNPDDVPSCACYRCIATYSSKEYVAYITVIDNTDPYFCTIESTLGTQIVNGSGYGAVYCRLFRGNEELDVMKSTVFSSSTPSSPSSGDCFYYLNKSNKSLTLKTYDGSSWNTINNPYEYTYKWYARNKNGDFINAAGSVVNTSTVYATGKVFYIDGSLIDGKITFNVEVS